MTPIALVAAGWTAGVLTTGLALFCWSLIVDSWEQNR